MQVLPLREESIPVPGFVADAVFRWRCHAWPPGLLKKICRQGFNDFHRCVCDSLPILFFVGIIRMAKILGGSKIGNRLSIAIAEDESATRDHPERRRSVDADRFPGLPIFCDRLSENSPT